MDQGLFLGIDKDGTRTRAGLIGAIITVPIVTTGREIFNYLYAKIQQKDPCPELMTEQTQGN
jgi:hypothetical protein